MLFENEWAKEVAKKICEKTKKSLERNMDAIPYLTKNGKFDDYSDRISWWTNGFYAGQLWQMYNAFGDDIFKKGAEAIEKKLDGSLMDYMGMDHDSGFKWLLTSVANYKITKNPKSKNRALLSAANLAGRFNLKGRYIRAWNDNGDGATETWAIIDCMMNLPLLYWASEETKDTRFRQIAVAHADTALKAFIREDGSVNHIVVFDRDTGNVKETLGGQGKEVGSSWTRGQSWAIYGFALSYRHTKDEKYLEASKKVARYVCSAIPENGIMPVDFAQEKDCPWEDSTAAAITACGLLELVSHLNDEEEKKYFYDMAIKLLKTLDGKRCNWDLSVDNITENGSAAYNDTEHNFPIIYGDYYFAEAILKLCSKELFMWG